jgi:MSHA pilin protein MshD
MNRQSSAQRGFTLLELIVFIIVISIGFVGILSVFNVTGLRSADPMQQKQMLSIAEAMLSEILLKDYDDPGNGCTPLTTPTSCRLSNVIDRQNYNDVSDYDTFATTGIYRIDGTAIVELTTYNLSVAVINPVIPPVAPLNTLEGVAAKRITVTVTNGGNTLSLEGYRTSYGG